MQKIKYHEQIHSIRIPRGYVEIAVNCATSKKTIASPAAIIPKIDMCITI